MRVGAIWEVNNRDKRYVGWMDIFYVVIDDAAGYFTATSSIKLTGDVFPSLRYDVSTGHYDKYWELVRLDLINGKLGVPLAGVDPFGGGKSKAKAAGKGQVHKCHCDMFDVVNFGCKCGGC